MMIQRLLERLGLIRNYSDDDVINAEIEDKVRDHDTIIGRLDQAFARRSATNAHLRESLKIAKHRTESFEQFERYFAGRND